MRKFKCYDCQHKFDLPHGEGGRGIDLVCPKCGSKNVHRTKDDPLGGVMNFGRGMGKSRRGRRWHLSSEDSPGVVELNNTDEP